MHTHRSTMHTLVASMRWFALQPEVTLMAVAPLFHVTGMQGGMNGPLYVGNTVVMLPRWDRNAAAECVQRYRIASWTAIPTMIQDFFANPDIAKYDLSSIRRLSGGGAAMPAAVAQRLLDMGVTYYEGYGLSETMAATHLNPADHPKKQCLGIPIYDVDSRVVDPATLQRTAGRRSRRDHHARPAGVSGLLEQARGHRPGLGRNRRQAFPAHRRSRQGRRRRLFFHGRSAQAHDQRLRIQGVAHRSGVADVPASRRFWKPASSAPRMRTAARPSKPWSCCRPEWRGRIDAQRASSTGAGRTWRRTNIPRIVEFVESLPKSGAGKIMWRELQDREAAAANPTSESDMKALLSKQPGGPETLVLEDIPEPLAGAGEVRIAVRACGVNFPDLLIIQDLYQYKPPRPFRARRRGGRRGRRRGRGRRSMCASAIACCCPRRAAAWPRRPWGPRAIAGRFPMPCPSTRRPLCS